MLDVGDGKVLPLVNDDKHEPVKDKIKIPAQFCDLTNLDSVDNMIESTYPDSTTGTILNISVNELY